MMTTSTWTAAAAAAATLAGSSGDGKRHVYSFMTSAWDIVQLDYTPQSAKSGATFCVSRMAVRYMVYA